ncbi:MAG: hypothetical protein D6755_06065 [Anaerolineae bacterium]|nr:MAG: hypothetical protein D6755_06065 [Anaerolineae bacterium]
MRRFFRRLVWRLIQGVALAAGLLFLSRLWVTRHTLAHVYPLEEVPSHDIAIVFGAGLYRNGEPTPVLKDRVATAVRLYEAGKVRVLLLSGDNRSVYYNEPEAMRRYALQLGLPEDALVLDYAGLRTYDTCYRARQIFGVRSAILVTQQFHLPRALYLCQKLGIEAAGVPADRQYYRKISRTYWQIRETLATLVALWEVHVTHPQPILGTPEPILITGGTHDS